MKPILLSYISLLINFNICFAQLSEISQTSENKISNLKSAVNNSELVVEGHVIESKCFKTKTSIYTSVTLKVTKVFKGNIADSSLEIIYQGGQVDGEDVFVADGVAGPALDDEGIFFLKTNNRSISYRNELHSYYAPYDFIVYRFGPARVGNHIATSRTVTYDNLEKDIFQVIETSTGQKRKILGLNSFERAEK